MTLLSTLNFLSTYRTVWVAYSGGLDSQVLLAACLEQRKRMPFELRAIHINHQLNNKADQWQTHCEQYCLIHQVPLFTRKIKLTQGDLENTARKSRYAIFRELLQPSDILLTAHHQEDQAETLLLQLLRGAGPKGLSGMPLIKKFGDSFHGRPFLNLPRNTLIQFTKEHQLSWVEDDSNLNTEFRRNFIRHEVMPVLKREWPSAVETIARSASHCGQAQVLLEDFSVDLCLSCEGTKPHTLSVKKLLELSPSRQQLVLRSWIYQAGFELPSTKKLQTIIRTVLHARWDSKPKVQWQQVILRRYRDDLYLMLAKDRHDSSKTHNWQIDKPLIVQGIGTLVSEGQSSLTEVTVAFRKGGERVQLAKRCKHELKKLFQEWGVLPWERDRVPLLFHDDKLIAALGYYVDPTIGCTFILRAT